MTNMPVRRRRRSAWWLWLVAALVLALLAWLLFGLLYDDDDNEEAATPALTTSVPAAPAVTPDPALPPLTDLGGIATAANPPELVGRSVLLADARVRSVAGDRTFWIGPSDEQQVFVVLGEAIDTGSAEGAVDVDEGRTISLTGSVQALPTLEQAREMFGLSEQNSASLDGEQIYLRADTVTVQRS